MSPDQNPATAFRAPLGTDRLASRSVLVVDDDLRALTGLADLLTVAGYSVVTAASFEDAKRLLVEHCPDLLIVDVRLGNYNGLHLMIGGLARRPEMATIVVTGYADTVLKAESEKYGATFVVKPIQWSEFSLIVAKALKGSSGGGDRSAVGPRCGTS